MSDSYYDPPERTTAQEDEQEALVGRLIEKVYAEVAQSFDDTDYVEEIGNEVDGFRHADSEIRAIVIENVIDQMKARLLG